MMLTLFFVFIYMIVLMSALCLCGVLARSETVWHIIRRFMAHNRPVRSKYERAVIRAKFQNEMKKLVG